MRAVVIEDSRTQAFRLGRLLEHEGFTTELATNGEEGLEICAAAPLDLVVTDVLLPGIDGFEVCRRLKSDPATAGVPVVLLTALTRPTDVVKALAAGADNFVAKPYEDHQLIARVRRTLTRRSHEPGDVTVEVAGEVHRITATPARIVEVLLSCLDDVVARNQELELAQARIALGIAPEE